MRITTYRTYMGEDRLPSLIKENSKEYAAGRNLDSAEKIVEMMNHLYQASLLTEEYIWIIAFDNKFKPLGVFEVGHGTVDQVLVKPRDVFMRLCLCGAANFVMIHNHTSGECIASKGDLESTRRMIQCGKLMGIHMADHIIIGETYYSFAENQNELF